MAYWLLKSKARNERAVILVAKCASTSIRRSITHRARHKAHRALVDGSIGICIRNPLERLRSAFTDAGTMQALRAYGGIKTPEQALDAVEGGHPIHNHVARVVDVLNFRYNKRDECTHCPVPQDGDELHFEPNFVFVYEQLPSAWDKMLAWLEHPPVDMVWEKKRDQPAPEGFYRLEQRIREVYAADYRLYETYANQSPGG